MGYSDLPRKKLGFFPTPLAELDRLSRHLSGPRLFVKRDDLSGLAFGGNKTRKLEFLIGEAIALGCDTVITGGAEQSNHCRQTAAAAAVCGLECHLVLGGAPPAVPNGNLLLDMLCGAKIHWSGDLRKGEAIPEIAKQMKKAGRKPFVIPYGGSNSIGAIGFVEAVRELCAQTSDAGVSVTHVVFPSSSGGTHAGLALGARLFKQSFEMVGIGIDKGETGGLSLDRYIVEVANETAGRIGESCRFSVGDITIRNEYLGGGYGIVGAAEEEAIRLTAEKEGLFLDPVYTGRAMAALIDLIRKGEFSPDETVLFWHTGGTPALFPYAHQLAACCQREMQQTVGTDCRL